MQLSACKIPFEREFRFHPDRKWRFDFAIHSHKLAVEVEGGVWLAGRHSRGSGYEKDCEKYNTATILGWRLIRVSPGQVKKGLAIRWIEAALSPAYADRTGPGSVPFFKTGP